MTEIWKPVVWYAGDYEVSDHGNIRSVEKTLHQTNRWGGISVRCLVQKPLKTTYIITGYGVVSLWKNGIRKRHYIHRLVAAAFIENKENLPQVNHEDGNKRNNHACNLSWVSISQNLTHSYKVLGRSLQGCCKRKAA